MSLKLAALAVFGLCAGGIIAAGVFAFLAIIGVFPRLIGKTGTKGHILLYETMIILGGSLGNALDLFEYPLPFINTWLLAVFGISVGIFVGCLVMSLAGDEPQDPYVCWDSVCDTGHRTGENAGVSVLFFRGYGKVMGARCSHRGRSGNLVISRVEKSNGMWYNGP